MSNEQTSLASGKTSAIPPEKANDSRYPYTYACDYLRGIAGSHENGGMKLSRSDASQIRSAIAKVAGIDDEVLACQLAEKFLSDKNSHG